MKDATEIGTGTLALLLSFATPIAAQGLREPPPRVEFGVVASTFLGARNLTVGIRTTIYGTGPTAFELQLDWADLLRDRHYVDQQIWFYSWQVKHSFAQRGPRSFALVSYGTLGWSERAQRRGDQDHFQSYLLLPILPLVGVGGQRVIGTRAAIRGDLQFIIWPFETGPVHPRVTGGVSIPLGRYSR
jgi:hypothetical protein